MTQEMTTKAALTAAAGTTFMGLTVDEWGIVGIITGIVFGAITLGINWYYNHKRST